MPVGPDSGVSVIVPTIGRVKMLERCLRSILDCEPPPDELVVIDQSGDEKVQRLVASFESNGVTALRVVSCPGRGIARATNLGFEQASHPLVCVTHDDCTVEPDW